MQRLSLTAAVACLAATVAAHEPAPQAIEPRRALIIDAQKQTVGTFPLFVHDGTRRVAPADTPPSMLQNLVTMETFSVRSSFTAFPFVTLPYGLGNGWTPGSGR